MAYHKDGEGIRVAHDWAGSIDRYTLEDSLGCDFPSISTQAGAVISDIWVVAPTSTHDLRTWYADVCGGWTDCNQDAEWTANTDSGGIADFSRSWNIHDPKIVTAGSDDLFALVQRQGAETTGDPTEVHLLSMCSGTTVWEHEERLPVPSGYDGFATSMGPFDFPGSGMDVLVAEGDTLRAVFIAESTSGSGIEQRDAVEWTASSTHASLCP